MNEIDRGLYQSLLTESLVQQLQELDIHLTARQSDLHVEEAPDRLAMHLAKVIQTAIASLSKDKRIDDYILSNRINLVYFPSSIHETYSLGELYPNNLFDYII